MEATFALLNRGFDRANLPPAAQAAVTLHQPRESGRIDGMVRRFQFSLRALLILVFGLCCFFGGMALQWRIDHHPLSFEALYDSDGKGGFVFEMRAEQIKEKRIMQPPHSNKTPAPGPAEMPPIEDE